MADETNIAELRRRVSLIEQDVEGERGVSRHILRKVTESETACLICAPIWLDCAKS
jgi:hypothetical protein